jgi:hypothetical protein
MPQLLERRICPVCGSPFRQRQPSQIWCRAWGKRQAKALAGRAARRSWDDQGRPIQAEIREAYERDHRTIAVAAIRRR